MNGEELIEYLENQGDPDFQETDDPRQDGTLNFNSNLASLVPTKDAFLLDNMVIYDVMARQNRVHDSHTINEITDDWKNVVRLVEESINSNSSVYTLKGFRQHFGDSDWIQGGYKVGADVVDVVSDYFEKNTERVDIFDYEPREPVLEDLGPVNLNDKRIASACDDLDAAWITYDNDALAYRTDIEVSTPKRALETLTSS